MKENPPEVEAELDRRFAEAELRLQTYELEKQKLVEACYVEQVEPIVTEILTQTDWVDRISQFFESDIWRKFHALVFHFDSSEMPASHGIDLSEMSLRHLNFEKFTGHDICHIMPQFALNTLTCIVGGENNERLKYDHVIETRAALEKEGPQIIWDFLEAMRYSRRNVAIAHQGLAHILGYEIEPEIFNLREITRAITVILRSRLTLGIITPGYSEKISSGYGNCEILDHLANSKEPIMIEGVPGDFFLTLYNASKNAVSITEDLFLGPSMGHPFDDVVDQQNAKRLAEKLDGDPLLLEMGYRETQHAHIIEIRDNALGPNVDQLSQSLRDWLDQMEQQHGKDFLEAAANQNIISLKLKQILEVWKVKPSIYYKHVIGNLGEIMAVARLSGRTGAKRKQHSGLGMHAIRELCDQSGGGFIACESEEGGLILNLIFPKKLKIDPTEVTDQIITALESLNPNEPDYIRTIPDEEKKSA